jgi:hypothetical protein
MTKSRTAPLVPALLLLCWSGAAMAQPPPPPLSAEELIAAHNARILAAMGTIDGVPRCPRGGPGDDEIVVCGRNIDAHMRLPLDSPPEEGTRQRLVAGEPPSAVRALDVGRACCASGGGINVLGLANALGRGLGRIFHPD